MQLATGGGDAAHLAHVPHVQEIKSRRIQAMMFRREESCPLDQTKGAEVWSALLCKLTLSVSRTGAQANVSVCWQSASSGLYWWPFCRARPVLLL